MRQNTAYLNLEAKIYHEDRVQGGDSPLQSLSDLLNYIQVKFQSDTCIFGWVSAGRINKCCNLLLKSFMMRRQNTECPDL